VGFWENESCGLVVNVFWLGSYIMDSLIWHNIVANRGSVVISRVLDMYVCW